MEHGWCLFLCFLIAHTKVAARCLTIGAFIYSGEVICQPLKRNFTVWAKIVHLSASYMLSNSLSRGLFIFTCVPVRKKKNIWAINTIRLHVLGHVTIIYV